MNSNIFHLAFPITNITDAKAYYIKGLGCIPGRENPHALILNLYGHQLVAHITKQVLTPQIGVYPRHFGLIFTKESDWEELFQRAKQQQLLFRQGVKDRFVGTSLEHRTFFLEDPFFNLMEFKYYRHVEAIFDNSELAQIGDT
jgi:uncharacterized protein